MAHFKADIRLVVDKLDIVRFDTIASVFLLALTMPWSSGQSFKASMSVNYNSRVVFTGKLLIFTTLET